MSKKKAKKAVTCTWTLMDTAKPHTAYMIVDPDGRYVDVRPCRWTAVEAMLPHCPIPGHDGLYEDSERLCRQHGWRIVRCTLTPEK